MPVPDDNPLTPAKMRLGERLFFDATLSADRRVSCASCHDPARAFTSAARVAVGVFGRRGTRNVPTMLDRGYGRSFFWDGRAATLEEQVLAPSRTATRWASLYPRSPRACRKRVVSTRVRRGVREPPRPRRRHAAIATYVREQRAGDAPFDRIVRETAARCPRTPFAASACFVAARTVRPATSVRPSPTSSFTTPASRGDRVTRAVSRHAARRKTAVASRRRRFANCGSRVPTCTMAASTPSMLSSTSMTRGARQSLAGFRSASAPPHPREKRDLIAFLLSLSS